MTESDKFGIISEKLEKIRISQGKTESSIQTIEGRGCAFGHTEREAIKESVMIKETIAHDSIRGGLYEFDMVTLETIAHDSIRAAREAIDKKIESQNRWLKGLAAIWFLCGIAVAWIRLT